MAVPKQRIGLNALLLAPPGTYRAAGASSYIAGIAGNLAAVAPEFAYTAWVSRHVDGLPGVAQRQAPVRGESVAARVAWEQTLLPARLAGEGVDLFHGMAFSLPLVSRCPRVVTVFDMSFALFPRYHARGRRLYLSLMTRLSARVARRVIAISESTRHDICRLTGIEASKVVVVPCGVGEQFLPLADAERERFRLDHGLGPYLYFQGTLEPRKNLVRLVQAFARIRERGIRSHTLVLGGAPGWGYAELLAEVERLGLDDAVVFAGYTAPEEAPRWYGAADLFVFPSLYEGFGLPPLEAMACGTPVVAANASSIPEVVGEAGVLVPPTDVEALAEAMASLIGDEERRRHLGLLGCERARSLTWRTAAKSTAAVYSSCLE